jgi:HlyD family secretion protein
MPILILIVAIVLLAVCRQIYRITNTRTHGAIINAIVITMMLMVVVGLFDSSTATLAQDDTSTDLIPIIESAVIQQTSVSESINATGSIVPSREVSLAFQYSARVTEVLVDVGDRVEEGQLLARVNSEDIEEIFQDAVFNAQNEQISFDELVGQPRDVDLAAAEASLKAAQLNFGGSSVLSGYGSTQAEIQRMQLELAQNRAWQLAMSRDNTIRGFQSAGAELESYDPLGNVIDAGFFSINLGGPELEDLQDQYDGALSQYYLALNSLNAAEANTAYAEAQYQAELVRPQRYGGSPAATLQRTQAQQELDRLLNGPDRTEIEYSQIDLALANFARAQAELQLDYVELVAPFSGVITELNMTVGEIPPPTGAIVMIDDSQFKVNLDIDEIDIMQIQVGQPVNFIVDALPDDSITGIVELVALTPNRGSQVVSYNVRVLLDATSAPIRSGMSTTGQVIVSSIQGTLGVAPQFIYNDSITGTPFVVVVTDTNELQRIPIILGDAGNQLVEITGGITPGQRVVLVASDYIEQIPYRGNTNG